MRTERSRDSARIKQPMPRRLEGCDEAGKGLLEGLEVLDVILSNVLALDDVILCDFLTVKMVDHILNGQLDHGRRVGDGHNAAKVLDDILVGVTADDLVVLVKAAAPV